MYLLEELLETSPAVAGDIQRLLNEKDFDLEAAKMGEQLCSESMPLEQAILE